MVNNTSFNVNRPSVVYAYGFTQTYNSNATQRIVEAYIARNDHNILVIDWYNYSTGDYLLNAVPNTLKVADVMAKALLSLNSSGYPLEKIHVVGHSLGAHLAAKLGRSIIIQSSGQSKLKRITGLDPSSY